MEFGVIKHCLTMLELFVAYIKIHNLNHLIIENILMCRVESFCTILW